jgi:hypothetical protein
MRLTLRALTLAALVAAAPAAAQDTDGPLARVSVHGFLSQGYARGWEGQVYGASTDGTTDYRTAALQVRYDADENDNFLIQFNHERVGSSPMYRSKPVVDLDWAFVEHRFTPGTSVRVGRVKLPVGIYNETRKVGTLMPLYRAPMAVYTDVVLTSESLDGIAVGRHSEGGAWGVDLDAYYGGWRYRQTDFEVEGQIRNAVGGQAWIHTPLSGLRLGLGGRRFDSDYYADVGAADNTQQRGTHWQASLDGTFARGFVRGEYQETRVKSVGANSTGSATRFRSFYGQVGVTPLPRLTLVGQAEKLLARYDVTQPAAMTFDNPAIRDVAAGARFAFRPDLVAKAEYHWTEGIHYEDGAGDFTTRFVANAQRRMRYGIVSVSYAF